MLNGTRNHQTLEFQNAYIAIVIEGFLRDRKAAGKAPGTIEYYAYHLKVFHEFCTAQAVEYIGDISPDLLRRFLLLFAESHKPGGVHASFRALRVWLRWVDAEEIMPAGWRNPIHKVKAPTVPEQILDPVPLEAVSALLAACKTGHHAERDRAIFLLLLDTGIRARELCRLNINDLDPAGAVTIHKSKSNKPRLVYISRTTRRAIRAYLRTRTDDTPALFVTTFQDRMTYNGLREILRRRARDAGITEPTLHQFRRAFAVNFLRSGGDIFTLQKLMGHADLSILHRYLKLSDTDTQQAHAIHSPVERLK